MDGTTPVQLGPSTIPGRTRRWYRRPSLVVLCLSAGVVSLLAVGAEVPGGGSESGNGLGELALDTAGSVGATDDGHEHGNNGATGADHDHGARHHGDPPDGRVGRHGHAGGSADRADRHHGDAGDDHHGGAVGHSTGTPHTDVGHGHAPGTTPPPGHDHGAVGTTPPPGHDHGPGTPPPTPPDGVTPAQRARAEALLEATRASITRWSSTTAAAAAGFRSIGDGFTGFEHWVHWDWLANPTILDPNQPESLVYRVLPDGTRVLESAMYILPLGQTMADVPDVGGALTPWHVHTNLCWNLATLQVVALTVDGVCHVGTLFITPPMLHVWIVDTPCGPFAEIEGVQGTAGCHTHH
jgi:hypothetical protein